MRVVREFDPWKSALCTCPKKFSFNPYTGCSHGCIYCYATYIPRFHQLREKRNLFRLLEKDLREIPEKALISMSNSSDPYPPVEKERGITRRCLEIMKDYDVRVLVVTKSDLVVRDAKILGEMESAVSITITGLDWLEPGAPKTESRIKALKAIKDAGIPAILRLDPVIPFVNDRRLDIIERTMPDHVVTSTLKLKPGLMSKLSFLKGFRLEKRGHYSYFSEELRKNTLERIRKYCEELGISVGFCREGIRFNAESCDGSHLLENF